MDVGLLDSSMSWKQCSFRINININSNGLLDLPSPLSDLCDPRTKIYLTVNLQPILKKINNHSCDLKFILFIKIAYTCTMYWTRVYDTCSIYNVALLAILLYWDTTLDILEHFSTPFSSNPHLYAFCKHVWVDILRNLVLSIISHLLSMKSS